MDCVARRPQVCAKAGQWRTALSLLEHMSGPSCNLKPTARAVAAAGRALGRGGEWAQALDLVTTCADQYGVQPDVQVPTRVRSRSQAQ